MFVCPKNRHAVPATASLIATARTSRQRSGSWRTSGSAISLACSSASRSAMRRNWGQPIRVNRRREVRFRVSPHENLFRVHPRFDGQTRRAWLVPPRAARSHRGIRTQPPQVTFPAPIGGDGSEPTGFVTIDVGGKAVEIQTQRERLDPPYDPGDCLATVYAMLGSLIETLRTGKPTTYTADVYSTPGDYFGTPYPSTGLRPGVGAPALHLGTTLPMTSGSAANSDAFAAHPFSTLSAANLPAIIGGNLVGTHGGKLAHFMLAVGIEPDGRIKALDPLTGGVIFLMPNGAPDPNGPKVQGFQAIGFVTTGLTP